MIQSIEQAVRKSILCILERFERSNGQYDFVDTKFDIVSDRDFDPADEEFRQKGCIYAWIQGRGLESLAKHAEFFEQKGDKDLAQRLKVMLARVADNMEKLRAVNHGRLPFAMRENGESFFVQVSSEANYSDLFYSKGLFAAGRVLNNPTYCQRGRELLIRVLEAVRNRTFRTDQQSFDPKNQVEFVQGKFQQGPRMISLGGIADMLNAYPAEQLWSDYAEEFINFILQKHVNNGQYSQLQKFDFIESLDESDQPWYDGAILFSDPGHALEFTGLAAKCLTILHRQNRAGELIKSAGTMLPQIFCHVFDYGFSRTAGGVVKGYDLISRQATNSDMPWWSLPESVRSGILLSRLYPQNMQSEILLRTGAAFQAFTQGFLQKNGFGCQTRDENGKIINVIPAVSDADPGYHTNLSLLDVL